MPDRRPRLHCLHRVLRAFPIMAAVCTPDARPCGLVDSTQHTGSSRGGSCYCVRPRAGVAFRFGNANPGRQGLSCTCRAYSNFNIPVPATAGNSSGTRHGSTELCDAKAQPGLSAVTLGVTDDNSFIARAALRFRPYCDRFDPRGLQNEEHDRRQSWCSVQRIQGQMVFSLDLGNNVYIGSYGIFLFVIQRQRLIIHRIIWGHSGLEPPRTAFVGVQHQNWTVSRAVPSPVVHKGQPKDFTSVQHSLGSSTRSNHVLHVALLARIHSNVAISNGMQEGPFVERCPMSFTA